MKVKTDKIWLLVLIPTIVVCLTVFLIVKSAQERENDRIMYEILEEQDRQYKIDQCYVYAHEKYSEEWDNTCLLIGRPADCSLPVSYADDLDKTYEAELDRCIVRYSN